MNILLSNDDGIQSEGIIKLALRLSKKHNILIIAPDGNRSGFSHSLSFFKKLNINRQDVNENIPAYVISGTPADCVKFASHELSQDFPIDLVVSGINKGHNLGTDVLYSGTVSVAVEGATFGYKSMAFSSCTHEGADFDMCAEITEKLIDMLLPYSFTNFIWNVNIPHLKKEEIKGVKFTPLGRQLYSDNYQKISENEYVLVGKPIKNENNPEDCDVEWSNKGYVTITPLLYDKTDYSVLTNLKDKEIKL